MSKVVVTNVMAELKAAKPTELVELPFVRDKFIALHNQFHGDNRGEQEYHLQVFNYKKILAENEKLRMASPLSLYGVFLDINVNQLSLEQGNKPDCYITTRNFKVGENEGKPVYETRAQLQISPYGEVKMRMRSGQIKHADNPIVVYDCDNFKVGLNEKGKLVVKQYDAQVPKPAGAKIIACFVRIERYDGSFEMPYLDLEDIERLKGYSNRSNFGNETSDKSNKLYSSNKGQIDPGFLKAKTLKHAFKSYPKVPTGKFSVLEPTPEEEFDAHEVDYGLGSNGPVAATEDVDHQEVDEFDQALNESQQDDGPTLVYDAVPDEEEPAF
ncbi:MAG: recombinase RecT [Pedobacter sp.]|nr:recombinase RecT [Pedobacter sp.]